MNPNTGEIKAFESARSVPNNYVQLSQKAAGILSKFTRKERKHLWATYQILNLTNKTTFNNFVETLVQAYNPEKV